MRQDVRSVLAGSRLRTYAETVDERIVATTLPHCEFGDPDCCGCLTGVVRGDQAEFVCNECGAIVRTVPAETLQKIIDELELSLTIATAKCPHCGAANIAPGFSKLTAYVCEHCGEGVNTSAGLEPG